MDNPDAFNEIVLEACAKADKYDPQIPPHIQTNGEAENSNARSESQSPNSASGSEQSPTSNGVVDDKIVKVEHQLQNGITKSDQPEPAIGLLGQHENAVVVQ